MKRLFTFFLAMVTVVSLCACGTAEEASPTEEKRDYSAYAGIVQDPKTWYEEFMALPIANESMTEDQLRQLCADAFKYNLSFQWTPTQDITFNYTLSEVNHETVLPKGIAYSGLMYNNNVGTGTVWKVLNYYDLETGAVDVEAMGGNTLRVLTSACSMGALQGWNRVSNSHGITDMYTYNQGQCNISLVGPYDYTHYEFSFSKGDGTDRIIAHNGEQVMCESYAATKTADGLYSSSAWHVMMCSATPVVVRKADGTIDKDQSYLLVHEQGQMGTISNDLNYQQENGKTMRPLGRVNQKYTFQWLLDSGYVPFTLKEFTGEEPVEPGEAWLGTETTRLEKGMDLTAEELFSYVLYGNYNPCTVEVQVKNAEGNVLLSYAPELLTDARLYYIALGDAFDEERLQPLANGSNTIHLYVRLANGELLEAYSTILKMQ